ncbi:MAG TPA: hypothetical protein V6D47_07105 [Oscillatoriaceae cyanobacterium]
MQRSVRLVFAAIALTALVGCGKATPVEQPPVIDSVFTRMPGADAPHAIAIKQQQSQDSTVKTPETDKADAPSSNQSS